MHTGSRALALAIVAMHELWLASCRSDEAPTSEPTGSTASRGLAGLSAAARSGDTAARRALAESGRVSRPPPLPEEERSPLGTHRPAELDTAARRIIGFLRGEVEFDLIRLADTVALYLGPEPGGVRRKVTRQMLRDRSNWTVRMKDMPYAQGMAYSFVPPKRRAELTTRVGRYFNCMDRPLPSMFRELVHFPRVGIKLMYGDQSCLQSWNLTLFFEPNEKPPTLVAAVYDQFEW
jgi:hypothetical protein